MNGDLNMYGVDPSLDEQMRALPMLTAHRVWKQAGTPVLRVICETAGVRYESFALVRIGKKNFTYTNGKLLQYAIFLSLGVVVNLDTLCNAIGYREHEESAERRAFEAAKVSA
jgi:hypothetical protein